MVCVRIETVCVQQILLFCFVFLSPSVSLTAVEVGGKMSVCGSFSPPVGLCVWAGQLEG